MSRRWEKHHDQENLGRTDGRRTCLRGRCLCAASQLQKAEFPDGYATISGIAEIPAGGSAGRHTHPGVEMGYLLEGEADLVVEGKPDQHLKAGDSYMIPPGTAHDAKVHGDKPLKILGVYVVDKTKPFASPAP